MTELDEPLRHALEFRFPPRPGCSTPSARWNRSGWVLIDDNEYRPHGSLANMPPAVFEPSVFNRW